ncbi:MAG: hypothetical protein IKK34_08115 [Clostridia bacterium]|nr:hypothetical protein [Clostridia bacterium]
MRRMQFNLAKSSPAMAIFLGKNMLGQSDDPNPMDGADVQARANAQTQALADLINHPVAERTMEEIEAEGDGD